MHIKKKMITSNPKAPSVKKTKKKTIIKKPVKKTTKAVKKTELKKKEESKVELKKEIKEPKKEESKVEPKKEIKEPKKEVSKVEPKKKVKEPKKNIKEPKKNPYEYAVEKIIEKNKDKEINSLSRKELIKVLEENELIKKKSKAPIKVLRDIYKILMFSENIEYK